MSEARGVVLTRSERYEIPPHADSHTFLHPVQNSGTIFKLTGDIMRRK